MLTASMSDHLKLIDIAPTGMALCRMDRTPVYVNQAFASIVGYSCEEMTDICCIELTPAKYDAQEKLWVEQLKAEGSYGPYEKEFIHKDGHLVHVRLKGVIVEIDGEQLIWSSIEQIDDVKKAQELIRKSEERFALAMKGANDGLWDWDFETDEVYYSPRWKEMLGYQEHELQHTLSTGIEFICPDEQGMVMEQVENYKNGLSDSFEVEFRMRHKLGHWVHILSKAFLVKDEASNRPIRLVGTHQDISERKRSEQLLQEANARYKSVAESMSDWIWEVDANAVYTYSSSKIGAFLGYREDEIIGKTPFDFMPPEEAERVGDIFKDIVAEKRAFRNLENWNLTKTGQRVCLLTSGTPILGDDGQLLGYRGVDSDITERKRNEEALRRLSLAVECGGEAIMITDTTGAIEYVNPAFTDITGYAADDVIGKNPRILKSSAQDPSFYADLWSTISSGKVWNGTLIDRKKDGSYYPAMMSVAPIKDESGTITHYVSTQKDMTRHQQLEDQVRQAQKMESIGTLVGGIAHDFNNMLAAIDGNVFLAKRYVDAATEVDEKLNNIEQLSMRAADMVRQLLTYARKGSVSLEELSLNVFMQDAFELVKNIIPENIEYTRDDYPGELIVKADPTQLQQVIMNLTNNARHAVAGVHNPEIMCSTRVYIADDDFMNQNPHLQSRRFAKLTVCDNGCGISKENLQRVTEPFFTTKGVGEGTGLGLSMVYGSIQRHGGVFRIESELGKGTSCHIYLPLIKGSVQRQTSVNNEVAIQGHGETILLVDDQIELLNTTSQVLKGLNYQVLLATNGEEALEIYQSNADAISLVFTDVVMPKVGGRGLMKNIWDIDDEIPAIFATGYDHERDELPEDKVAQTRMLSKPYVVVEISKAIRSLLDGDS